jgi:signal transduction histidine kinase
VARELHDDLNQKLAILAMESETLEQEASSSPYIRERLGRLRSQLGELSESVHRLAYQLHPSILDDLGLAIALQSYVSDFSIREGIKVKINAKDIPSQLPPGLSLCLYRITQECLRNIAKHSQANQASVKLQCSNHSINLSIKDSGVGFDQETVHTQKGGLGIISMQERVRLLHGKIRLKSRPAGGTQVQVSIPLPAESR